ncbi:uncharacterized protein LOC132734272 [Ruditapes philippinarum]|uniref:uncharacterized protein LOC132734272 n=1 Tax=Ruditapes philippinarum TaxID=129788 RepID=UPI00295AC364|nr:uncharacterized protein LOC132734272 [Ruditapes philippinarum]
MNCAIMKSILPTCLILIYHVIQTEGHGRLVEPPSRSSMWRYGFQTPVNYDDNQLFCGGFDVQWNQNGGRCGVCGDPYNGQRDNEAGGKYATGTISRHYTEGQTIPITIDVTTNHGGFFEFRICPNNNPARPVTESCLNMNILRQPNGETKWRLPAGTKQFTLNLVLPRGLTCSQCVLQWKWNTASNWGCDNNNNNCCKGCGPQEQFLGCADVSIASSGNSFGSNNNNNVQSGFGGIQIGAVQIGVKTPEVTGDGFIPIGTNGASLSGSKICEATATWKARYIFADQWCRSQCAAGNCPVQYCKNTCRF